MRFGPERGHFLFIFEHFFRDFGLLLGAGILYLLLRDTEILWQNSMLLILVLFAPVKRLIQYLCTRYSVDDKSFYVESGWLKAQKEKAGGSSGEHYDSGLYTGVYFSSGRSLQYRD